MNQKLKNKRGITLIALVVTIVVLLILAGVSISLILDNNGIIQKSKNAKLETRASQVEDEIGLWKQNNFIKSETGESIENADSVLESLISRGLLEEDEIDRENEIITIKKKDKTIVKEISYGSIRINISKIPETEKSLIVLLKVTSVEGMTIPNMNLLDENDNVDYTKLEEFIIALSINQKKELFKNIMPNVLNKETANSPNPTNFKTFEDIINFGIESGEIPEGTTEEQVLAGISEEQFNGEIRNGIMSLYFNEADGKIIGYNVINPDNENADNYLAKANGTYTFKIQDVITGKIYTKKIEVNNIETTADSMYKIVKEKKDAPILLHNVDTNIATTFEKAYIRYNNEIIDITDAIRYFEEKKCNYLASRSVGSYLVYLGKMKSRHDICDTNQLIIIIKNDKLYAEEINMGYWIE